MEFNHNCTKIKWIASLPHMVEGVFCSHKKRRNLRTIACPEVPGKMV